MLFLNRNCIIVIMSQVAREVLNSLEVLEDFDMNAWAETNLSPSHRLGLQRDSAVLEMRF